MNNSYNAYSYNPYNIPTYQQQRPYNQPTYPQAQQMPTMQMPMQQTPADMPIQDIKFVNSAQAEAYIVYPNTKVLLIDMQNGIAHLKCADGMGQSQTQYFKFVPSMADGSPLKQEEKPTTISLDAYVKREELTSFGYVTEDKYKELLDELNNIKKYLSGVKQNGSTGK